MYAMFACLSRVFCFFVEYCKHGQNWLFFSLTEHDTQDSVEA